LKNYVTKRMHFLCGKNSCTAWIAFSHQNFPTRPTQMAKRKEESTRELTKKANKNQFKFKIFIPGDSIKWIKNVSKMFVLRLAASLWQEKLIFIHVRKVRKDLKHKAVVEICILWNIRIVHSIKFFLALPAFKDKKNAFLKSFKVPAFSYFYKVSQTWLEIY